MWFGFTPFFNGGFGRVQAAQPALPQTPQTIATDLKAAVGAMANPVDHQWVEVSKKIGPNISCRKIESIFYSCQRQKV
jgi:hypothetical protein